jgi:hypothetical protein
MEIEDISDIASELFVELHRLPVKSGSRDSLGVTTSQVSISKVLASISDGSDFWLPSATAFTGRSFCLLRCRTSDGFASFDLRRQLLLASAEAS